MKTPVLSLTLAACAAGLAVDGFAQTAAATLATADPGVVRSAIDLVRADVKTEKAIIIAQNLSLTPDEDSEFWPLYNEYSAALNVLLDERLVMVKDYLATHEAMTDAQATALAGRFFDLEAKRTALKRTWFKKFTTVLPPKKVAQFFQVENQLNAAMDLVLMDSLPLIK
jgi:hypothetical protein